MTDVKNITVPKTDDSHQNSLIYKCLMYSHSKGQYPRWIGFLSPFVSVWYYGLFSSIDLLIPYKVRRLFSARYQTVKIPPCHYSTDEAMFHACFVLLGKYVEEELGPAPSEKEQYWNKKIWGYETPTYNGYRLHSNDEEAIDLWIWYSQTRNKIIKKENELLRQVYGPIDGIKRDMFSNIAEPLHVATKREEYYKEWQSYLALHYGLEKISGHPRRSEDLDCDKLAELMKIRRNLWT